ncbi:4a-hydroxytetrahydrobiopterin dehydratase [Neobacillus kokaensis]|uniref:Putative pterin-4-alpha-carbinolamine dehydratase n=1 Tax=Neobacillus kokaensis TaxID=2759023 RepID=A0ABQ3MZT6_9BACI|nr:4a-hydroxytetrahydrobiopterin dehydratase [Neobacillus kokaensis]GHH97243.1 4a-hydroxytetrahydrobiopterin dehydratase [Neobacillus kokaensis]
MRRLTDDEITESVAGIDGWNLDEKFIVKRYLFREFLKGIAFVNEIAQLSEEQQHHPFISIDYKLVTLRITSWSAGGLTDLDFDLAKKYDEIFEKYTK